MLNKEKYPRYPGGEALWKGYNSRFRYRYAPTSRSFRWSKGEDGQVHMIEIITLKMRIGRLMWRILNYFGVWKLLKRLELLREGRA